ncbi:MAG: copper homeostasis protein CutC [Prevotella sp.]|nr:copper homeostasis protein CutC [Bacteroidales bacterium]MDY4230089.1 copper homeostasis protein CutC [Prevotella sp.]
MTYIIENCANGAESARRAQEGGADRVELCAGIPEGGTTPSAGEMRLARRLLTTTRLNVIIRPRGGDFCYTDDELSVMAYDIGVARQAGADGVVFGALRPDGSIHFEAMRQLMEAARGMSVTFHRAFDVCRNPIEALEQIVTLGCDRILSSGQEPTAEEGIPLLALLNRRAADRIAIMPGCGVNAGNIAFIAHATGCHEFHFSGRSAVESPMEYRNPRVSMGGTVRIEEYSRDLTDPNKIRAARKALLEG